MKNLQELLLAVLVALMSCVSAVADNYIRYTTSDEKPVELCYNNVFGANFVSNTYENVQGKLLFDGEVTIIGDYAFYSYRALI